MKTCSVCKVGTMKKTLIDTVERVSQKGFVNLKNVPCKECDNCGHLTFSTEVEKKIEQLINNSEEVGDKLVMKCLANLMKIFGNVLLNLSKNFWRFKYV